MEQPNLITPAQSFEQQQAGSISARFHLGYRPALDGYRGVAILLVLLNHLGVLNNQYGFMGVVLFFVLSGFLITCLLLEEWDQNHAISLRAFYARRALRLLPALITMLVALVICTTVWHTPKQQVEDYKAMLLTLTYSMNWAQAFDRLPAKILEHTWSLSIEEQFYLIWPAVLLWMLRRKSRTALCKFAALSAVLSWQFSYLLYTWTSASERRLARGLDTRADALLIGCAIGIALASGLLPQSGRLQRSLQPGAAAALLGLWLIPHLLPYRSDDTMLITGWSLMSVFGGILLLALAMDTGGWIHWIFTRSALVYIGKISYGLYLWHFPVIVLLGKLPVPWVHRQLMIVLISITLTLLSYYLIELPCLRLKKQFQKVG